MPRSFVISIHAPREGGDLLDLSLTGRSHFRISIHAPREGGDNTEKKALADTVKISIHAPREGGDHGGPRS